MGMVGDIVRLGVVQPLRFTAITPLTFHSDRRNLASRMRSRGTDRTRKHANRDEYRDQEAQVSV